MESMLQCKDCSWMGLQEDCVKYEHNLEAQDVQPTLECPKCGGTNLREILGRGAVLEPCLV